MPFTIALPTVTYIALFDSKGMFRIVHVPEHPDGFDHHRIALDYIERHKLGKCASPVEVYLLA